MRAEFQEAMRAASLQQEELDMITAVKHAVATEIRSADPSVTVTFTDYYNHTIVPDMTLRWPEEKRERLLYVRPNPSIQWLRNGLGHVAMHKPLVFTLEDLEPGGASQAPGDRDKLDRMAKETGTWITDPSGIAELSRAQAEQPRLSFLGQALVRGGRGLTGGPEITRLAERTAAAFMAPEQSSERAAQLALQGLEGSLSPEELASLENLSQLPGGLQPQEQDALQPLDPGTPRQVGNYKLAGKLGAGGMGRVYLGISPEGRKVAVKVLRPQYIDSAELRARFAREVDAARRVSGLYTAPVIDADPHASPPWLVTAYIPGPSLDAAVARNGPLSPGEVRDLGLWLAEGLAAIHESGLVHRDLKPSNILLADDGPRIIDFGIAQDVTVSRMTSPGMLLGTFAYMSPEQISARPVGPESDVFSLGAVLVYAATGHPPFDAPFPVIIARIATEPPDLRGIRGTLRDVIVSCLQKNPADRPTPDSIKASLATVKREPG